ncbi:unnamed protein product [Orchesella dallaii]|uniref:UDENN FLCN/SMCR8-type domain-containing protein n=1 Tax=Orchesella dallaii TaxID=48710 RepID=A0ABP1RRD3_9HEXA
MTVTAGRQQQEGTALTSSNAMSLTYSDFLYARNDYTEVYEDDAREVRRSLPSDFKPIQETKVPLMQNAEGEDHDFIIIAEFSELEGPIPLCTIPNDAADKTDIPMNDFVVHLMSTDYQVNTVGQFRICQDTQVMRKNVFPDVHVFMQYFTLYDIKARGFVRPFCLGYVSKDHKKLDKYVNFLITEFAKVTAILEDSNRRWFSKELRLYLDKLQHAKESYIQEFSTEAGSDKNQFDEFVDADNVSLDQIAHQYSEIHNILTVVQGFLSGDSFSSNEISDIIQYVSRHSDSPLINFLKRNGIISTKKSSPTASSESLNNIPLVHPLRPKGEPLRPLSVLGQHGSVHLVAKLMQIYDSCKVDILFTEMTDASLYFTRHFENLRFQTTESAAVGDRDANLNCSPGKSSGISSSDLNNSTSSNSATDASFSDDSKHSCELSPLKQTQCKSVNSTPLLRNLQTKELYQLMEKLHIYVPVISDNKSGSYHTVSEEESDVNFSSQPGTGPDEQCGVSALESTFDTGIEMETRAGESKTEPSISRRTEVQVPEGDLWDDLKMNSLHSFSSDEELSLNYLPSTHGTSEETIMKEPWWIHASKKLVRGVPGYGLANFFRRYHQAAHHVLYSILLGRPIIICGEEKLSRKIGRIITALIPLVPAMSTEGNKPCWKLLRWHRGILVQAHIETFRIIGMCIPEKLEIHDLIPPRLVTLVTILSADKKCILGGPAYSGDMLQNFEKNYQKHFYNSDVSLLAYIGGIYSEIESKVYTYKSLLHKYKSRSSNNVHLLFKELNIRASDIEIIKYLGNRISDPSECVNIL